MRGTKAKRLRREAAAKRALQPEAITALRSNREAALRAELSAMNLHDLKIMAGQSWGMSPVWKYKKPELIDAMVASWHGKEARSDGNQ